MTSTATRTRLRDVPQLGGSGLDRPVELEPPRGLDGFISVRRKPRGAAIRDRLERRGGSSPSRLFAGNDVRKALGRVREGIR